MNIFYSVCILLVSYLIGAIPFGLIIVRLKSGKDIRQIESGRTGGTNAFRAAGLWAGVATALLDGAKAASAVWIARYFIPGNHWLEIIAPLIAILGHNYSIFLAERKENGSFHLRGGAGGAPCAGGAFGLWYPSLLITLPAALLILVFGGYASVATMSIAFISTIIFTYRAIIGASPWQYILYGVVAEAMLIWALRPNIKRLIQGNERLVGVRAQKNLKRYSSSVSSSGSSDLSSNSSSK
ncbi:MAG: glycerol-3-phosphate acyltransferase [Anaerolineales bacterium]|nr:glycerol-3-phosphate acyltransferase [Anaerolineales bacterium]